VKLPEMNHGLETTNTLCHISCSQSHNCNAAQLCCRRLKSEVEKQMPAEDFTLRFEWHIQAIAYVCVLQAAEERG
jgi:hypothetical protein